MRSSLLEGQNLVWQANAANRACVDTLRQGPACCHEQIVEDFAGASRQVAASGSELTG